MADLQTDKQSLEVGDYVELYTLDLTGLGGSVHYFVEAVKTNSTAIVFQDNTYTPVDIEIDGFEVSGKGTLAQPIFRLGNATRAMVAQSQQYDDLRGAKVTRLRTLKKYLDGEPGADPNQYFEADVFYVDQKSAQNKIMFEWKLVPAIDLEGLKLPRRVCFKNYCPWVYRRYVAVGDTFNYTKATCPWVGLGGGSGEGPYFDLTGAATTRANDKCGKRLSDCKARFGATAVLPYGGFPGMVRR